jgi:hypothetical protein
MSQTASTNGAAKYDYTYRFRTHKTLKTRAERVAKKRGFGDAADIGREGVIKLIEAEEQRLGLPPIEELNGTAEPQQQPQEAALA